MPHSKVVWITSCLVAYIAGMWFFFIPWVNASFSENWRTVIFLGIGFGAIGIGGLYDLSDRRKAKRSPGQGLK